MRKGFTKIHEFFKNMSTKTKILLVAVLILIIGICLFLFFINKNESNDNFKITNVTAKKIENGIVANDTSFVVETEDGSAKKLKEHIYLEPAVDYDVKEVGKDKYEIKLGKPIGDNTIVNVDYIKNGVAEYKWAFQTKKDLSVNTVYPADGASYVDEKSAIEIAFSYPNVKNFEEHFQISPSVAGTFTNNGRIWTFVPSEPLKPRTKYTITVTPGIESNGQIMTEEFKSSFSTYTKGDDTKYVNDYITFDKVNTFLPSEKPTIGLSYGNIKDIKKIELYSIDSYSDYMRYLSGENIELQNKGEVKFTIENKLITLENTLNVGYYVFYLIGENNDTLTKANVQVNDTSAYALLTQRDVLVWVSKDSKLKSGESVKYKNKTQKTNDNGYTVFKEVSDFSGNMDYLTVGDGASPLIIGLKNYDYSTLPSSYIYSDRPLYKTNDVINIWGYIPIDFFADKPDLDKFYIKMEDEKFDIEVNSDGTFIAKIDLKNYKEVSTSLQLYYNDSVIARRYINIENYNAKNYIYTINTTKNYARAGENLEFDVVVEHVTGLKAANKDVVVTFEQKDYYGKTDNNGIAKFSIPTTKRDPRYIYLKTYSQITINGTGADYTKYLASKDVYVYNTDIDIQSKLDQDKKEITYDVKKLDLTTITNTDNNDSNMIKSNYSGKAMIYLYETITTRVENGQYYDPYEKEYVKSYSYNNTETVLEQKEVDIVDGKVDYKYDIEFKKSTEDIGYSNSVKLNIIDSNNNNVNVTNSIYYDSSYSYDNKGIFHPSDKCEYCNELPYKYDFYNYELEDQKKQNMYYNSSYSIGDNISLKIFDEEEEYVKNKGTILEVAFKERIDNIVLIESNDLNYKFSKKTYPGSNLTGVYFVGGKFHRMPVKYYDYNSTDSELSVVISPNKKSYKPGDEVTGTIKVVDKNGKLTDSKLNISVVNEAVFNSVEDSTKILSTIFTDKELQSYTFSTYRDFTLGGGGGKGATGGSPRADFGDTVYFDTLTAKNGKANFKFKLNDDITKFRITVHAVAKKSDVTYVGVNNKKITSTLPLSITSVTPKDTKSTDDLVLNATILKTTGNNTKVNFKIKETGKEIDVNGSLGDTVTANFGKLDVGTYNVIITGTSGEDSDSLTYKIDVIETAQEVAIKKVEKLENNAKISPTKNPIIIEVYNKKVETYLNYIKHLESHFTSRLDTQIAYYKASELKNEYYDQKGEIVVPDFSSYISDAGIKNLNNAEVDLILTGLINYYASDYVNINVNQFNLGLEKDENKVIRNFFIRASFKDSILVELNSIDYNSLSLENKLLVGISYAFLGDYNNASKVYRLINEAEVTDTLKDLYIVLASFIDKPKVEQLINTSISERPSSEYLNFAILSYFENNMVELNKKETVTIKANKINEKIVLQGLKVKRMVLYNEDLKALTFKTKSKDLLVSYYYQGKLSEDVGYEKNLNISLDGTLAKNNTVNLNIDIANLPNRTATINVALPNSLRLSGTFDNVQGLYLNKNNNGYISLGLTDLYKSNNISIPLYVSSSGNYEVEPIIIISDNKYYISNNLIIDIN